MLCLGVYIIANTGLALQSNGVGLMILRCLQSSGSSGFVLLGSAIVADVATTAERGTFMSWGFSCALLAQAFGPIIGSVVSHFFGWRAIFWFLIVISGPILLWVVLFLPETCRKVVGNGSIPAQLWNVPLWHLIIAKSRPEERCEHNRNLSPRPKVQFGNPFSSIKVIFDKITGPALFYAALSYAAFYFTLSSITHLFALKYGYNDLKIGLSFMPIGMGCFCSSLIVGKVVDWNYRRHARRLSYPIKFNRQMDLGSFPIERARLEVALPMVYSGAAALLVYGWLLEKGISPAGPFVFLFIIGFCNSGNISVISTLILDVYPKSSAVAIAATNLFKCSLGAAASGFVLPLIDAIGIGWANTAVSLVLVAASSMLWISSCYGPSWRTQNDPAKETTDRDITLGTMPKT